MSKLLWIEGKPLSVMSKLLFKDPSEAEPTKPKMVLYGPPGVGKTMFTLSFPNVAYFSPEPGATRKHYVEKLRSNGGGMYLGPEDGSTDFEVLISQAKALATERHKFKTLAVDSISEIFNLAVAKEAERLGDKNAFGADKKPAIAYMRRFVQAIARLDMNVILVAHEKAEWGEVNGQRAEIGKVPDCWDKLLYSLDLAFQAQKTGPGRYLIVKKSRLAGFPEGERFKLDFEEFSQRYGKDIVEKPAAPIQLASPEQTAEIKRLIDLLKVEQAVIDKWLEKANAETIEEFPAEYAGKITELLNKKLTTK
jgi:hypothetical protein